MSLFTEAVASIAAHVRERQTELDAAAYSAWRSADTEMRRSVADSANSQCAEVLVLVSTSLRTLREGDGMPTGTLPADIWMVVEAANAAGMLGPWGPGVCLGGLEFFRDGSGLRKVPAALSKAVDAWGLAKDYRDRQCRLQQLIGGAT